MNDKKLSGKLNSPYGYMTVYVKKGIANSAKIFHNGHPVEKGKLVGCENTHEVPKHWITLTPCP